MLFGLVVNKLLLAYKNKPSFLEQLVLQCTPSMVNIYLKIRELAKINLKNKKVILMLDMKMVL